LNYPFQILFTKRWHLANKKTTYCFRVIAKAISGFRVKAFLLDFKILF